MEKSLEAGIKHKEAHDQHSKPHNLKIGDKVWVDNQVFLNKNKKFAKKWTGPYLVTDVLNKQNVELQLTPRRRGIRSVYRLKKFVDPK